MSAMQASERTRETRERTVLDLLEAVFRHRKKAVLFFFPVVVTVAVVLALTPGTYTSTAKLMIGRERESGFLKAAEASGELLPLYKEWENEINSELEILTSHELVSEVVQSPEIKILLAAGKTEDTSSDQIGQAIQRVEENLKIEVRNKSDIIIISYTATSPELAQQVVMRLVSTYLDKRIAVRRAPGEYQFFSQQTDQLLRELHIVEESIRAIKSEAGISSLEDSCRALQTAMDTVRTLQMQNGSELAVIDARIATLRTILAQQASPDFSVKSSALLDRTEYQALQSTLRREEITQASLTAGSKELDQQFVQLREKLAGLNALGVSLRKLAREQELLEEKYRKYSEDKEQARINEDLETRKISNVSIVQQATLPTKADPSVKLFKLLAAVFLGAAGSIAVALGAAGLDPALYSAAEVSDRLHLPVLIELPVMPDYERDSFTGPSASEERFESRFMSFGNDVNKGPEDCFQELLFKLLSLRESGGAGPFVIGVTSSSAGEGVSNIAANLAAAFARDDRFANTLLLDASKKNPSGEPAAQAEEVLFTYRSINVIRDSTESKGRPGGVAMFINHLAQVKKQDHDVVVVDLPHVSQGADTARMAAALDLVILVIAAGRIPWRTALRAAEMLSDAQAKLCGIILNRKCVAMPEWLYRKLRAF
jgi:uncharacterized protein involved in exopolysaccharide biosynthesis/Mrp family chromosome partitioning ATPase